MRAVIRQGPRPEDHFTMISNAFIRSGLPPRAKVVYMYLRSLPDSWQISTSRLAEELGMAKKTVRAALDDLIKSGYVDREQNRSETGRFSEIEYRIFMAPSTVGQKLPHGEKEGQKLPHRGVKNTQKAGKNYPAYKEQKNTLKNNPLESSPNGKLPTPQPQHEASSDSREKPPCAAKAKQAGSHLPEDWWPPQKTWEEMRQSCPQVDLKAETMKFRDYWLSASGQQARKRDWSRAWRLWIRRSYEYSQKTRSGTHSAHGRRYGTHAEDWFGQTPPQPLSIAELPPQLDGELFTLQELDNEP